MRPPGWPRSGPTASHQPPAFPTLVILGNQLRSVVVGLLVAAILLSLLVGDHREAVAIA